MTNIIITNASTKQTVSFEPYITKFSDNFKSDWQENFTIGRMDPIANFKRTTRIINIGFEVMCQSIISAQANKTKIERLSTFLYPVYKEIKTQEVDNVTVNTEELDTQVETLEPTTQNLYKTLRIASSLEERLNLRPDVAIMSSGPIVSMFLSNMIQDTKGRPLYGYINNFNINPIQEMGFLVLNDKIYPKGYSVDVNFSVIHSEPLGWKINNKKRGGPF